MEYLENKKVRCPICGGEMKYYMRNFYIQCQKCDYRTGDKDLIRWFYEGIKK